MSSSHTTTAIMAMIVILFPLLLLQLSPLGEAQPEQIHLSYGYSPSQMVVMWSTPDNSSSVVLYGTSQFRLTMSEHGECREFTKGNPDGLHWIHKVVLQDLSPGVTYWYAVQSGSNTSDLFRFTAMQEGQNWSPELLVYGDMGRHGGAESLPALIEEVASRDYAAILHIGDFAYDLHSQGGVNGDEFMNRIQDLAAYVPYMTCPGNHEHAYNFSHYLNRFSMPYTSSPHWYSWDIAHVHFISYTTEVYFDGWGVEEQYAWLEQDLQYATAPGNRSIRPWIIAYGHRPMYCSNIDGDDCTTSKSIVRAGLEELFYRYGVDVILEAHEHSYERLWPVYNEQVTAKNYINPEAPIHIISAAAGCNDVLETCIDPMLGPRGPWSAYRSWWPTQKGYGRLKAVNGTHLFWEQVVARDLRVQDSIWIVQYNHRPFGA